MENEKDVSTVLGKHLKNGRVKQAAFICGVSQQAVYAWCEGRNHVPDHHLVRLMRAFPEIATELLGPDLLVVKAEPHTFDALTMNSALAHTTAVLAKALEDGKIDHIERPEVHNVFNRLWGKLGRALPVLH
jgi:hypothetical protein